MLLGAKVTVPMLGELTNALSPIDVTLAGIVMLVRRALFWNAASPIDVTLVGIITLVKKLVSNALSAIVVTGL